MSNLERNLGWVCNAVLVIALCILGFFVYLAFQELARQIAYDEQIRRPVVIAYCKSKGTDDVRSLRDLGYVCITNDGITIVVPKDVVK